MFSSLKHIGRLNNIYRSTGRIKNVLNHRVDKCFYKTSAINQKDDKKEKDLSKSSASKYDVFIDEESPIILDVEQEREKYYEVNDDVGRREKIRKEFVGISPERGVTGVIEIEELVSILNNENATDMVVIRVPIELHYVDYLVLASGRTQRHMTAMAEYVRRIYKYKTKSMGTIPRIEGHTSKDWIALDLGNIALHIMSHSARNTYNLESLWALDKEYDIESNQKEDEIIDIQDILLHSAASTNTN